MRTKKSEVIATYDYYTMEQAGKIFKKRFKRYHNDILYQKILGVIVFLLLISLGLFLEKNPFALAIFFPFPAWMLITRHNIIDAENDYENIC